jgi:hypothetical protein
MATGYPPALGFDTLMGTVTFLSDYGWADDFVGVCHAVIARIAPDARVIDLTHGVARHDVRGGALTLARALPFAPPGVHLAVVDPEVGAERRAVAVRCAAEDRILVGPDNGLLRPAADAFGGPLEAIDIARSPHRLEPVSATFHGRDLFAPVAAHLAAGAPFASAGDPIDVDELTPLDLPEPVIEADRIEAHALAIDGYGNVQLDVTHEQLAGSGLKVGRAVLLGEERITFARTFSDVPAGELVLYEDAYRRLALAVNRGSAAERLGLAPDDVVTLAPA